MEIEMEVGFSDSDVEARSDRSDNLDRNSEGGSDNDRPKSGDEAEEEARRIDPETSTKKRIVRNPIPKLNTERLKGPKGVHTIEKYFEGFKFEGKGHERTDLDRVMKRIEHWAHRLFPKYNFDDFLERAETLGSKKDLNVFLHKYRRDMITGDDEIVQNFDSDKEDEPPPVDEFDRLINEQIERQKAAQETMNSSFQATQSSQVSSPAQRTPGGLSDEVKARIERNRQLAVERRNERMRQAEEEAKRQRMEEDAMLEAAVESLEKSNEANVSAPADDDLEQPIEKVDLTGNADVSESIDLTKSGVSTEASDGAKIDLTMEQDESSVESGENV